MQKVTVMKWDQPDGILFNWRKNRWMITKNSEERSWGDSGDSSRMGDFSEDENMPPGKGQYCMTLACSAYRSIGQISDFAHSNPDASASCHPDKPDTTSQLREMSLGCRDIGIDCMFEVTEPDATTIMRKFIGHAATSHNLPVLPADLLLKIQKVLER